MNGKKAKQIRKYVFGPFIEKEFNILTDKTFNSKNVQKFDFYHNTEKRS
jgi:hypothetical protein